MADTNVKSKIILALIIIGTLIRFIPHPLNFTPIAAIALFSGTYIQNKRNAILIPILLMLCFDVITVAMLSSSISLQTIGVYLSIFIITNLGFLLRGREQRQTIMVASLLGSMLFFFLTNFFVWLSGIYPFTSNGLGTCYVEAIPAFKGTIMGDLFFNLLFFGLFGLIKWASPIFLGKKI